MTKRWLWLMGLLLLAVPARSQMTAVTATVQDANGQHYVNCSWSVVFVGQNTIPGAGPYQPAALLVGQQGSCNSSGVLTVSLADNIATVRPTPSQWNFSICSAPGYIPGGTYCRSNMLVTITGASQNLTSFFQPLMPLLPSGGGGGGSQYITDATPLGGLMRTGSTLGLQTTCIAGQYLGWNGSAWACTTPGGGGVNSGTLVTVNGTQAVPNQLNFNSTSPLPPAGSQNVTFQLNGNSVSAYVPAGGGGGGGILVNGSTPSGTVNFNASTPPPPPNGINVNWTLQGTNLTGAIVGDGNQNSCLIGTGIFAACPGGGGGTGGVSSINGTAGAFNFTGAVACSGTTCNFTGGGALPTTPQYDLFSSTGAGGAAASGVFGTQGFLRAYVLESTGTGNSSPFTVPNGSIEYFPTGGYGIGATNGVAIHFSHSANGGGAAGNGGVALAGGNATGANYQIYLDCEQVGCDFKVPVTQNGTALGGGGSPGVSSINGTTGAFTFTGPGVACGSPATTCTFTGGGGGGSGTVGAGTGSYFAWYPATGTTVASNPALNDNGTIITSTETLAAPGLNVIGSGGISMTGAGGNLPTPLSGQGGIGIGPGNVPQYYSNGGAWTAIGSGGGGGTITGPTANGGLVQTSTTLGLLTSCANGQVLQWSSSTSTWACASGATPTIPNPILSTAGTTLPNPTAGQGSIGIAPNGVPSISIAGGGWLPIATNYPSSTVGIAHGSQAMVCQASNTQVTGAGITISSLTIGSNETAIVTVAAFFNSGNSFTAHDNNNVSYTLRSPASTQLFVFTSAVGASQPASSITVAQTTGGVKFVACVASYTGVTAIGVTGTNTATSGTQSVSINAAAAGNYLFSLIAIQGAATSTFTPGTGTLLPTGTTGTSTTATSAVSAVVCENVAAAAGSVTCSTTSSVTSQSWTSVGVELVDGAGSSFSPQCPVTSDIAFGTGPGTMCSRTFPAGAKAWIVKCAIPWNFAASQSGTANVTINVNQSALAGTLPLANPMVWTGVLWGAAGPVFGDAFQSNTGPTQVIFTTGLSLSDGHVYTAFIDGVANIPAAGGTFSITMTSSTGTGSIRSGAYCNFQ